VRLGQTKPLVLETDNSINFARVKIVAVVSTEFQDFGEHFEIPRYIVREYEQKSRQRVPKDRAGQDKPRRCHLLRSKDLMSSEIAKKPNMRATVSRAKSMLLLLPTGRCSYTSKCDLLTQIWMWTIQRRRCGSNSWHSRYSP
jgi:hypothetical protein